MNPNRTPETPMTFPTEIKYNGFTIYITEVAGTFQAKTLKPFVVLKDGEPSVACYEINLKGEYAKMLQSAQEGYDAILAHIKHIIDVEAPKAQLPDGATCVIYVEGSLERSAGWYHPDVEGGLMGPFDTDFKAIKAFVEYLQFVKASAGLKDILAPSGLVLPSREIVTP